MPEETGACQEPTPAPQAAGHGPEHGSKGGNGSTAAASKRTSHRPPSGTQHTPTEELDGDHAATMDVNAPPATRSKRATTSAFAPGSSPAADSADVPASSAHASAELGNNTTVTTAPDAGGLAAANQLRRQPRRLSKKLAQFSPPPPGAAARQTGKRKRVDSNAGDDRDEDDDAPATSGRTSEQATEGQGNGEDATQPRITRAPGTRGRGRGGRRGRGRGRRDSLPSEAAEKGGSTTPCKEPKKERGNQCGADSSDNEEGAAEEGTAASDAAKPRRGSGRGKSLAKTEATRQPDNEPTEPAAAPAIVVPASAPAPTSAAPEPAAVTPPHTFLPQENPQAAAQKLAQLVSAFNHKNEEAAAAARAVKEAVLLWQDWPFTAEAAGATQIGKSMSNLGKRNKEPLIRAAAEEAKQLVQAWKYIVDKRKTPGQTVDQITARAAMAQMPPMPEQAGPTAGSGAAEARTNQAKGRPPATPGSLPAKVEGGSSKGMTPPAAAITAGMVPPVIIQSAGSGGIKKERQDAVAGRPTEPVGVSSRSQREAALGKQPITATAAANASGATPRSGLVAATGFDSVGDPLRDKAVLVLAHALTPMYSVDPLEAALEAERHLLHSYGEAGSVPGSSYLQRLYQLWLLLGSQRGDSIAQELRRAILAGTLPVEQLVKLDCESGKSATQSVPSNAQLT